MHITSGTAHERFKIYSVEHMNALNMQGRAHERSIVHSVKRKSALKFIWSSVSTLNKSLRLAQERFKIFLEQRMSAQ